MTEQLVKFVGGLWDNKNTDQLCDFKITTNGNSVSCHRVILSASSSFFSDCQSKVTDVSPLPLDVVETVVSFMYKFHCNLDSSKSFKCSP